MEVPGSVAERADVREPGQVERAPERLPRDARDQPRPGEPSEHFEGAVRVREMLEDLAADHELGGMAGGIELLDRGHLQVDLYPGGLGPLACLLEHRGGGIAAAYAEPVAGQPDRELALAASHAAALARMAEARVALARSCYAA